MWLFWNFASFSIADLSKILASYYVMFNAYICQRAKMLLLIFVFSFLSGIFVMQAQVGICSYY